MSSESQSRNRGRVLSILDVSRDDWIFKKDEFNSVLDKVGNRPVAIYSINGEARGGKSFLLNYFIRHFEEQLGNSADKIDSEFFESANGVGRVTVGMNLWSKPYFVQTDVGEEVAVLLLDTQGLFDPQTPFRKNAVIFTISCFLSSVMMYNQKGALLENVLEDIRRFSNYAKQLTYNRYLTVTRESGHLIDTCSNLLFILRDFDVLGYSYGLHNAHETPQEEESDRNYFFDVLSTTSATAGANVIEESREIRRRLLHLYSDLSAYLLPHPGKNFHRRRPPIPDEDFEQQARNLVRKITSRNYIAKKVILGDTVTSSRFKLCIESMVKFCTHSSDYFPDLSRGGYDELIRSTSIVNDVVVLYETKLNAFISDHPEGVSEEKFKGAHCDAKKMSRDRHRTGITELDPSYVLQIKEKMKALRIRFEKMNKNNIFYSKVKLAAKVSGFAVLYTAGLALPFSIQAGVALASSSMAHPLVFPKISKTVACAGSAAAGAGAAIAGALRTLTGTAVEPAVGSPAEIVAAAPGVDGEDADEDF